MSFADGRHATDDQLERYSLGRLAAPELEEFEEHLLVCTWCQDRVAREDAFAQGMRSAAAVVDRQPPKATPWRIPKTVWAIGLAAVLLLVVFVFQRQFGGRPSGQPAVVLLQTTRGAENPAAAGALAGQPIVLALDRTDLPQLSEYRVEIVNAVGRQIFQSKAVAEKNQLRVTLPDGLSRGAYFVRIYSPTRELLREYALHAHP